MTNIVLAILAEAKQFHAPRFAYHDIQITHNTLRTKNQHQIRDGIAWEPENGINFVSGGGTPRDLGWIEGWVSGCLTVRLL